MAQQERQANGSTVYCAFLAVMQETGAIESFEHGAEICRLSSEHPSRHVSILQFCSQFPVLNNYRSVVELQDKNEKSLHRAAFGQFEGASPEADSARLRRNGNTDLTQFLQHPMFFGHIDMMTFLVIIWKWLM